MMPFSTTQDEAGPITRTVEDAARMLDVMAGYDPADPITAFSAGHIPASYTASLDRDGLKGARIGLLTDFIGRDPIHADVNARRRQRRGADDGDGRDGRARQHSEPRRADARTEPDEPRVQGRRSTAISPASGRSPR